MRRTVISPQMLEAIRSLEKTTGTVHEPEAHAVPGGLKTAHALCVRGLAVSDDYRRGAHLRPSSLIKLGAAGRALLLMGCAAVDGWRIARTGSVVRVTSPDGRRCFSCDNVQGTAAYADDDAPAGAAGFDVDVLEAVRRQALARAAKAQGRRVVKDPIRSPIT